MDREMYHAMAAHQTRHWWYRARRAILTDEIARLPLPRPARVLEAGCGPGGNLGMLARFGAVCAFDFDAEAIEMAAGKGAAVLAQGALPDAIPFGGPFDLIAALDVVEHLDQDVASVAALKDKLSPEGRLVITVPAYQFLWSEHDRRNHHKRRYTQASLRRVLEAAGIAIERMTYFNSHLFPLIAGVRLAARALRLKNDGDDRMPSAPVNAALEAIFAAERHVLPVLRYPFGVSILAIGRRG